MVILVLCIQITRLLPDAVGTTCGQHLEKVFGTEHTHILRVPFRNEKGIVRKWISRFEVWPYLETYTEVDIKFLMKIIMLYLAVNVVRIIWFVVCLGCCT